MDYSKQYFNKTICELTYEDIEQFFQEEQEENETLEFKSGLGDFDTTLTNKIIKTITAFLNSSGGILIWGAPKEKSVENRKGKICQGDLTPMETFKEKDQLVNIISGKISYMPTGIHLERLEKGGKCIYIFEIIESESKPHQYNGCYHIRLDGQSTPAPHYLVDALFKQIKFPNIEGYIKFNRIHLSRTYMSISLQVHILNWSPTINEKNVTFELNSSVGKFNFNPYSYIHDIDKLAFGKPVRKSVSWNIDYSQLAEHSHKARIILSFMGENSPAKVSEYIVDLSTPKTEGIDCNKRVTRVHENRTLIEIQDEIGHSKEEKLKILLDR